MGKEILFEFNIKTLQDNYMKYQEIGKIFYPLKTNKNEIIIQKLRQYGIETSGGFLISNVNHLNYLLKQQVKIKSICMMNPIEDDEFIKEIYDKGIRFFIFDDAEKLKQFTKYADLSECTIGIRLNPNCISKHIYSHIGIEKQEIATIIKFLHKSKTKTGLTIYMDQRIKNKYRFLESFIHLTNEINQRYKLDFISIAGISTLQQNQLLQVVSVSEIKEIIIEPGTALINNVCQAVIPIIRTTRNGCIVKASLYQGFFDQLAFGRKYDLAIQNHSRSYKLSYSQRKNTKPIIIYGGSSDSLDIIGKFYISKDFNYEEDSKLVVKNIGAYFQNLFFDYGSTIKIISREREI